VWFSADSGLHWTRTGLENISVSSLAVKNDLIFAGTDYTWPDLPRGAGVRMSTDGGLSWMPRNNGLSDALISSLAVCGTDLFAGTRDSGVFRSTNDGADWIAVNSGLTGRSVNCLFVNGTNLFAGTKKGACLSANNGDSWVSVNNGLTDSVIYSFASNGANLFAASRWSVFHSTDLGGTWNEKALFWDMRSFCSDGMTIFAGSCASGSSSTDFKVQLSADNGTTWTVANSGLTSFGIFSLTVAWNYLFAGGVQSSALGYIGRRLWRRPLSEMITPVQTLSSGLPTEYALSQNYPNPFNPTTTISYQLPTQSHVTFKVFDVLGREVATLVNGVEEPGYKSVRFDAGKLSSGIYFYRLVAKAIPSGQAGNYLDTRKLLLLR
jgi:hypothetical protein